MLRTSLGLKHIEDPEYLKKELTWIRSAGFDTVDLETSMQGQLDMMHDPNGMERAREARRILDDFDMDVQQGHAPFGLHKMLDPEYDLRQYNDVLNSLPFAAALGIRYFIIHPFYAHYPTDPLYTERDLVMEKNFELFREFSARADDLGVKLCIENMYGTDLAKAFSIPSVFSTTRDLNELMDAIPGLTCCFDTGHALVNGYDLGSMVRELGSRLTTLHVHHNDHHHDLHIPPFMNYESDWQSFCKGIKDIGYTGSLNLEVGPFTGSACPDQLKPYAYEYLHATAVLLAEMIENA